MAAFEAGDVTITQADLTSIDGNRKANLLLQLNSINIYENILKSTIYAEFHIADSIDLLSSFPIIGEEYIQFQYNTPGMDTPTNYKLYVYAPSDGLTSDTTGSIKYYTIKCCSQEVFKDSTSLIYKKYKDECSNMISSIVNNELNSKKTFNYEKTKGIQEVVVSSMNPLAAIDYIRKRSVSQNYKSSSFVFFENKNGYNFSTIEFLFDKNKGNIGDKIFFYDSGVNESLSNINFRNILGFQHLGRANTLHKLKLGTAYNNTKYFDVLTGDYKDIEFSLKKSWKDFKYPVDNPLGLNTSNFLNTYDNKKKFKQFIPIDSSKPNSFLPDTRGALQAFIHTITQNMIQIHTYGDSVITAGDVITCNLPNMTGMSDDNKDDRLVSGNYLISKLRHMFVNGSKWKHTMSMELINGTFTGQV